MIKKNIVLLMLYLFVLTSGITYALPHEEVGAALSDFFSAEDSGNQTIGYELYDGGRSGVRGGQYRSRFPIVNISPVSFTAPTFSASCGGISLNLGSLSVIDSDEVVQFIQAIGPNMVGYAAKVAFAELCPGCANAMSELQETVRKFASLSLNSCKIAQDIVDGGSRILCESYKTAKASEGSVSDRDKARENCKEEATAEDITNELAYSSLQSNPIFYSMKKNRNVPAEEPDDPSAGDLRDLAVAELVMTISGIRRGVDFSHVAVPPLSEKQVENLFNYFICGDVNSWSNAMPVKNSTDTLTINPSEVDIVQMAKAYCSSMIGSSGSPIKNIKVVSCKSEGNYVYEHCGLNSEKSAQADNWDRPPSDHGKIQDQVRMVEVKTGSSYMNDYFAAGTPYMKEIADAFQLFVDNAQTGEEDEDNVNFILGIANDSVVPLYKILNVVSEEPKVAIRFFNQYLPYLSIMQFNKLHMNNISFTLKGYPPHITNVLLRFSEISKKMSIRYVTFIKDELNLLHSINAEIQAISTYQSGRAMVANSWLRGTLFK